jgi:hypothetical protein
MAEIETVFRRVLMAAYNRRSQLEMSVASRDDYAFCGMA